MARLLRAEGPDGSGAAFQVQGATAAGNYVGKWGAAEELALSGKKSAPRGAQPFQLLADYADQNDARAGALFAEFAGVFKGRRQLVWSPGLKKLAGIDEVSDEQAAEMPSAWPTSRSTMSESATSRRRGGAWCGDTVPRLEVRGAGRRCRGGCGRPGQQTALPSPSHWQAWGGCLRGRSGRARAAGQGVWGQHAPQRRSALGGPEASPRGLPGREGKRGYNLLYPVVSTCFSKQVLDHPPNNRKRRYFLLL